jgi:hypothetical protein
LAKWKAAACELEAKALKVVQYEMCKYVQTYDRDFILVGGLRMIVFLNSLQCWNFRTIYGG